MSGIIQDTAASKMMLAKVVEKKIEDNVSEILILYDKSKFCDEWSFFFFLLYFLRIGIC